MCDIYITPVHFLYKLYSNTTIQKRCLICRWVVVPFRKYYKLPLGVLHHSAISWTYGTSNTSLNSVKLLYRKQTNGLTKFSYLLAYISGLNQTCLLVHVLTQNSRRPTHAHCSSGPATEIGPLSHVTAIHKRARGFQINDVIEVHNKVPDM